MKSRSLSHKLTVSGILALPVIIFFTAFAVPNEKHTRDLKIQGEINQLGAEARDFGTMALMMGIGVASVVGAAYYDVKTHP